MTQTTNQTKPKQTVRERAARERRNREIQLLVLLGAIALIALVIGTVWYRQSQPTPTKMPPNKQELLVREDSPSRGSADAPVTLVEFLDPECDTCRDAYPIVEKILKDYEGRVHYVVRYIPNHTNSRLAIAALEAAGEQGKYWEMLALLFDKFQEWGERTTPQTDAMIRYAAQLGLDAEKFAAGLQNPAYMQKVDRDRQDAVDLGIFETPVFAVNGTYVYGANDVGIRTLIQQALSQTATATPVQ